jgi:hypothetical protein
MTEQCAPARVAIRCDLCLRRRSHPPALAEAIRSADGTWEVRVVLRGDRRNPEPLRFRLSPPTGRVMEVGGPFGSSAGGRAVGIPVGANHSPKVFVSHTSVQLTCRRRGCSHRPRETVFKLVELAKQAVAAGQRDVFA